MLTEAGSTVSWGLLSGKCTDGCLSIAPDIVFVVIAVPYDPQESEGKRVLRRNPFGLQKTM